MGKVYTVRKEYYDTVELEEDDYEGEDLTDNEIIEEAVERNNIEEEWSVHWDVAFLEEK